MATYDQDMADDIKRMLDRPLVLTGMMGAGKTRLGRALADIIKLPFTDSDDEVEQAAGMSIAEIFDKFGEDYFRDGEKRVIKRLVDQGKGVIATGGGAVMTPETADMVWGRTVSIWVRAEMDVMVARTAGKDKRPLLKDADPEDILTALAEVRYPVYEKADIIIDSHNGPVEAIVNQALQKLHHYLRYEHRKTG